MANKYAGTKTEQNLWEAFAGESMARNKYTYFASRAKKAGYEQIAAIFQKTAAYGHFGREDADFTWERTDRVEELRAALA